VLESFLILAAFIAGIVLYAAWERARRRSKRTTPQHLDMVVVHTRRPDDQSIKGRIWETGPRFVVLIQAHAPDGDGNWRKIPGQAVIPAASISWIQKLAAAPTGVDE
jgi:hypothetical protein